MITIGDGPRVRVLNDQRPQFAGGFEVKSYAEEWMPDALHDWINGQSSNVCDDFQASSALRHEWPTMDR